MNLLARAILRTMREAGRAMLTRVFGRIGRFFRQTRFGRALAFASLPLAILAVALWKPSQEPPIFDAQVHYNEESWERVPIKAIIGTARELNVPWMLVGSTPNEGTWRLHRADPQRVIPMLVPHRTREERETWFENPEVLGIIEQEVARGVYRGIGEFWLSDGQVDRPVVRGMVELAAKRNLVLHARSDANALGQLFAINPYVRILWAHAGMFTSPQAIGEMLDRYPRLWAELSHRPDVAPNGSLSPEWRELFLRHPNRFVLGTGTYTSEYWYQFRYMLDRYRGWLKDLPPDVAVNIAYGNGLDLFGLRHPS
jgi:hypothetical protein